MRVLVTGDAGFIGSHVAERLLRDGAEVRVLDSLEEQVHPAGWPDYLAPEVERVHGDVRHCFADVALAHDLPGWEPSVSLDDGMRELTGWLAGQEATDLVDQATAALAERGLTR